MKKEQYKPVSWRTIGISLYIFVTLLWIFISICDAKAKKTALQSKKSLTKIENLANGVLAIRGHMKHVTSKLAKSLAKSALEVSQEPAYMWLTPEEILALAANESDFRPWIRCGRGCKLDCGITQVRLNLWRRNRKSCKRLCDRLVKSPKLSFIYSARELTGYKNRYCKRYRQGTWRFRRCIYNIYNQGPFYARREKCRGGWKCIWRSRYYIRHKCFEIGIRKKRRAKWSCRKARSEGWIGKAYETEKR